MRYEKHREKYELRCYIGLLKSHFGAKDFDKATEYADLLAEKYGEMIDESSKTIIAELKAPKPDLDNSYADALKIAEAELDDSPQSQA
mgnify:CR=1 FL=1